MHETQPGAGSHEYIRHFLAKVNPILLAPVWQAGRNFAFPLEDFTQLADLAHESECEVARRVELQMVWSCQRRCDKQHNLHVWVVSGMCENHHSQHV